MQLQRIQSGPEATVIGGFIQKFVAPICMARFLISGKGRFVNTIRLGWGSSAALRNCVITLSDKLIASQYENNYGGAVKRLNAITTQLAQPDTPTAGEPIWEVMPPWLSAKIAVSPKNSAHHESLAWQTTTGLPKVPDAGTRTGAHDSIRQKASMEKLIMGIAIAAFAAGANAEISNFDKDHVGALPGDWIAGVTGSGKPHWTVESDASAPSAPNVLKQSGSGDFPWCVRRGVSIANGFVEVKFKPLAGREDQAGGVVWRWKDGNNYYVARANALENNVSLYYTENGRRKTIKYVDAPVGGNRWHTLRVEFQDTKIRVVLDGKAYIEQDDSHLVGSGSVTYESGTLQGRRRVADVAERTFRAGAALSYLPTKNWIVTGSLDHDHVSSDDAVRRLKRNRVSLGATFSF